MLYWLFDTYRSGIAILIIGLPLLLAAIPAPFVGAYLLGSGGQKTVEDGHGPRQRRIALAVQLVVGLAVTNLAILFAGGLAVKRVYAAQDSALLTFLIGPPVYGRKRLAIAAGVCLAAGIAAAVLAGEQIRDGGPLRELVDRLRDPARRREELGSAHFCYPGDFTRLAQPGPEGLRLLGAFYGKRGPKDRPGDFYRLDAGPNRGRLSGKGITLSVEDQARGMAFIGPPGSGKSQAGILPTIADTMRLGHSVIVADPQGELMGGVKQFATVTGHVVIIHDPSDPAYPRFNLAADIANVADAQAIARVMVTSPGRVSDSAFWTQAAQNLLAGCLLRFDNLGDILAALVDIKMLARQLDTVDDEARLLCGDFIHSTLETPDRKLALSIAASLKNSNLAAWAAPGIREATSKSDFNAHMLVDRPAILILRCPGRYRDVYGRYLGAVLQKLIQDLDTLGERNGGPLPRPVKIVLDEFPALGRLDPVVTAVNLVRKRRISFVLAAQTLAQLELIYGAAGTHALLSGLATQVFFGSCDAHTAGYVSRMLGKTTGHVPGGRPDAPPLTRQRDLMTPDEVIAPARGNCTLIYRYATDTYATQIVLLAHLTRMHEREDWRRDIHRAEEKGIEPLLLERPLFERATRLPTQAAGQAAPLMPEGYDEL